MPLSRIGRVRVLSGWVRAKLNCMTTINDRDAQTGALSRAALMNFLIEQDLDPRTRYPSWLACINIDNFKAFNAHNGHALGDEVLKRLATHVSAILKSADRLFRHGGDSFVIVFANAEREEVMTSLEQFRTFAKSELSPPQLASCGDPHCEGPTALSVSIGVAELTSGISAACWLSVAENQMEAAKKAGRDQICIKS